ncbi:MAG TPA: DUF5995 family protein [Thermoanaerobaculia bacterium]|jgi:hypothetical protein|nr:DUF5995 family protein [Thermoanaerobaculia bacterium]
MQAQGIDDVLQILDGIIADCKAKSDPLGYFPALYRQVTLTVKKGIDTGYFDNGPRMNGFDALFANRYFAAYDAFRSGGQPTQSWQLAFDSTQSGQLIILQDLLVAINAHINLDLGVVTGETFQGLQLAGFHDDFNKINAILSDLLPAVEATVGEFSPLLEILEKIGGKDAVEVLDFSLDAARDDAWLHAQIISLQPPSSWPLTIQALDDKVEFLGKLVAQPRGLVASAVAIIRDTESKEVPAIIDALNSIVPAA